MTTWFSRTLALAFVAILMLAGCDGNSTGGVATTAPAATTTAPVAEDFGEFKFEVPSGWVRAKPDREQLKAYIVAGSTKSPQGMVMVDAGKPAFPNIRDAMFSFTKTAGTPLKVDGVEALRGETASTDLTKPHYVVALMRGGKLYLIMAAGVNGHSSGDAFEHVLKTWHWAAPKQ